MSSSYSGVKTAAQAPSPAAGNDNVPIVVLPADGDALNAASVAQAFKTLADHVAWNNSTGRTITGAGSAFAEAYVGGASGGDGLHVTGGGSGRGILATGGTNASGGTFVANSATAAPSIIATNSAASTTVPADGIWTSGCIRFNGAVPTTSTQLFNQIGPKNFVKAYAVLTAGSGVITVNEGANIAGATLVAGGSLGSNGEFQLTLGTPMSIGAPAYYHVTCNASQLSGGAFIITQEFYLLRTSTGLRFRLGTATGTIVDLSSGADSYQIHVSVMGAQ